MFPLEVLREPMWQALTWTLLHFLWQGLAVAAAVAMLVYVWPVRRAHNRYLIYLSALIAMAVCPLVTLMVVEVPEPTAVAGREVEMEPPLPLAAEPGPELVASEIPIGPARAAVRESQPPLERSETAPTAPARPDVGDSAHPPVPATWETTLRQYVDAIQPYAMIAWIAGVMLLAVRLSLSWVRVRWLAWGRRAIPADLAARAAALGGRLGLRFSPRVCVSERIREAIVVGLWRPLVLLPVSWLTEMPPEVLEAVIAHELAHVRRFDLWVNLLQRLMETLLFYHPAVWWLSRRVGLEREMCADELAVGATAERLAYATALEQLGRMRLARTAPQFGASMGGNKMVLLNRVGNILGLSASNKRVRWWPVGLLVIGVLVGYAATAGEPPSKTAEKKAVPMAQDELPAAQPARPPKKYPLEDKEFTRLYRKAFGELKAGNWTDASATIENLAEDAEAALETHPRRIINVLMLKSFLRTLQGDREGLESFLTEFEQKYADKSVSDRIRRAACYERLRYYRWVENLPEAVRASKRLRELGQKRAREEGSDLSSEFQLNVVDVKRTGDLYRLMGKTGLACEQYEQALQYVRVHSKRFQSLTVSLRKAVSNPDTPEVYEKRILPDIIRKCEAAPDSALGVLSRKVAWKVEQGDYLLRSARNFGRPWMYQRALRHYSEALASLRASTELVERLPKNDKSQYVELLERLPDLVAECQDGAMPSASQSRP